MVNTSKRNERVLDAKIWRTGHSLVVTLPHGLIGRFNIKKGDIVELVVRV